MIKNENGPECEKCDIIFFCETDYSVKSGSCERDFEWFTLTKEQER